jgi:hypothetical protein
VHTGRLELSGLTTTIISVANIQDIGRKLQKILCSNLETFLLLLYWGLNSELHICLEGTVPPNFFVLAILDIGSHILPRLVWMAIVLYFVLPTITWMSGMGHQSQLFSVKNGTVIQPIQPPK